MSDLHYQSLKNWPGGTRCKKDIQHFSLTVILLTIDCFYENLVKWSRGQHEVFQKNCNSGNRVYDIEFCVLVCQLEEGDQCKTIPQIGDDLCATDLSCIDGYCSHT